MALAEESLHSVSGIIDSHAHYFDRRFENEVEGGADAVLKNEVFGGGILAVINVATNPTNAIVCIEQAKKYKKMYAAVGIHPEDLAYLEGEIDQNIAQIESLLSNPEQRKAGKIVALGEIGLDYHYENYDRDRQIECFEKQLALAEKLDLPVIIHDRDAHGDCFDIALKYRGVKGVFHSFSGSAEMAKELTKRGWYISFSGVLTFKNARRAREAVAAVPIDRILVETDCPYLAPVPHRGHINSSAFLCYTVEELARILDMTYNEAVELTSKNAKTLFNI